VTLIVAQGAAVLAFLRFVKWFSEHATDAAARSEAMANELARAARLAGGR
jgi:hypothetical protein